jgi:hypothetical protein
MNVVYDLRLYERYDMGGNRLIYVMLPLEFKDKWQLYKSCASQSRLKGAEVVTEIAQLPGDEITVYEMGVMTEEIIVDPITVEQPTQEEW